ncbi:grpE [Mucuna pruriens]|uniref:GrpE protein homolog n=1 Tax=Mucuna pruriens TaxID=157652 RepID=A0A371F2C9_MUCPR|nr:grpE [Mucuna pruriens]
MATVLRTPTFRPPPPPRAAKSPKPSRVAVASFGQSSSTCRRKTSPLSSLRFPTVPSLRFVKFVPFAFDGDTEAPQVQEPEVQVLDPSDGAVGVENSASDNEVGDTGEIFASPFLLLLQSYKEALANNDEVKIAELESSLKSIEDEKIELEGKIVTLSEDLSIEKDRILRISADFDNFRKRTERDRLSLVTNAQGEVVESLLPVLDNFERAKTQIKVETEAEEKINNSYQSIYKQFIEILTSLGVESVETVGTPFDPLLHEAIMREDSAEFEDGIIIQEFRKGFKLGDRLLRPSMVKVSAGPGPAKPEQAAPQEEQVNTEISEDSKENEGSTETESP